DPSRVDQVEAGVRHERQAAELLPVRGVEILAQLVQARLLDEDLDPILVVGDEDAVLLRDLVGFAHHRGDRRDRARPPVRLEHRLEVEVDDRVGREHERGLGDVPVLEHPERRGGAARRQGVVLDRGVLHVDAEALAVPDHHLDLVAVLLAVRDDVVVLDAFARQDLQPPADQPATEERHRRLRTKVAGRLERQRAGTHPLSTREADTDDVGHLGHPGHDKKGSVTRTPDTKEATVQPWSREVPGRISGLEIESEARRGNALGDPNVRPLWVYVPPGYDDDAERRFPCVYVIQGLTGQLDMWRNREPFRATYPESVDALFVSGESPPTLVAFVDCWTSIGGSPFLKSPGACPYQDFLCDEVVAFVDARYRTIPDRDHRGIQGKSSGGYGALVTPMLRRDGFSAPG